MFRITNGLTVAAMAATMTTAATTAHSITLGPDFVANYTATDLGSVTGVPGSYGGLVFKAGDPNTLLLGGAANTVGGRLYEVDVIRDGANNVTGFNPNPPTLGSVGDYNDGGVAYGPGGVLFTAQWPVNNLGQTRPGNTDEDRIDDLSPLEVEGSSVAAINFVPTGFSGAGKAKIVSWSSGNWYDLTLTPDGNGTYDPTAATRIDLDPDTSGTQNLPGGPEGFVYIAAGNPGFSVDSMLVSDYSANRISAYDLDGNGNPLVATRRDFLTGLTNAEGAAIDPLTGDFFFSTFGGGNRVVRVSGFNTPTPPPDVVPLPASMWLLLGGAAALTSLRRKRS